MVCRARPAELFETARHDAGANYPPFPTAPTSPASPGTGRLAYRLPMSSSPAWILFGAGRWLRAVVEWGLVVLRRAGGTFASLLWWEPDWLLILFTVPFALVGVALAVLFVRYLLVTTGIGPDAGRGLDHPLLPGREYELFISQAGRLKIQAILEVSADLRRGSHLLPGHESCALKCGRCTASRFSATRNCQRAKGVAAGGPLVVPRPARGHESPPVPLP